MHVCVYTTYNPQKADPTGSRWELKIGIPYASIITAVRVIAPYAYSRTAIYVLCFSSIPIW